MSNLTKTSDWREGRRRSAREAILEAAWALVAEEGLAGLSLRDLARRAGITTPTVYSYFDSKNAIYDAMFAHAATEFAERIAEPFGDFDPLELLVAGVRLFQHTLPGFEPSPESYAPAVEALAHAQGWLARNGITEARHLDLFTALVTGLVDQQISNDPGGNRWTRLIDESIAMFVTHCQPSSVRRNRSSRPTRTKGTLT